MIKADSLEELSRLAKQAGENSWLLVSQNESYPAGFTLGDEDSAAGTTLKMEMQLLLETPEQNYYFANQYQDEELYKEAISQLEELMEEIRSETVEPSVMEARLHQN
ncbi:hypothetical protein WQ57_13620 [Mesobacillus campisalis]|uniref:Uncharacterized protein n=2 Tax=Mesobacillus campisalis TaxID=1408103 RepID=A0A0M2SXZ0_9BACI|nr:hypothetical protein WQ57_13620 [Mesobacillus campisalis]